MSTPDVKILTRRLVRSPVAKLIFSARIRHAAKNDVLFIGENSVAIKEFFQDGSLEDVRVLVDFESNIMSARVYGDVKQPEPPSELSALSPSIKSEDTESVSATFQEIPPQILVLALDSGSLIFLFAHPDPANQLGFVYSQCPLYEDDSYTTKSGKHMAVDPQSRALAVAAHEGNFSIYSLKPMSQLKKDLNDGLESRGAFPNHFDPTSSVKHVLVKGIILQIDFLYPPPTDTDVVMLIVITRSNDKTYMHRYGWDCTTDLNTIKLEDTQPLNEAEELPLLLIPFENSPGFMLVFERLITVRGNILADWSSPRRQQQILQSEPPEEPGNCQQRPLWTQWARPVRRKEWKPQGEVIYLCREDGLVVWLELEGERSSISLPHNIGRLGINVDTAFASLDNNGSYYIRDGTLQSQDFLVAGGDMSEGGLFSLTPRHPAKRQQPIPNWAPVTSLTVSNGLDFLDHYQDPTNLTARQRVFASVGKGSRQGGVCEFRYGIPALSSTKIPIKDLGSIGILAMWIFVSNDKTTLLLTDPERSYVLELDVDQFGSIKNVSDADSATEHHLDVGARTVAAGNTEKGHIIQITEQSIRVRTSTTRRPLVREIGEGMMITAASIEGFIPALLIAVRCDDQFSLRLLSWNELVLDTKIQMSLSFEPSCVLLKVIGNRLYAFVGLLNGTLQIFRVDGGNLDFSFEYRFEGEFAVCDSIGLISKTKEITDEADNLLLCGLRNGTLHIFQLESEENLAEYIFEHCETLRIGNTSVTVLPEVTSIVLDNDRCTRAILVCKETLCRLEYHPNQRRADTACVNSIWLIDNKEPGFQHGTIKAVAQLDAHQVGNPVAKYLFCIEREDLHVTIPEPSSNPRALLRRWKIEGTPNRLIYSKALDKLIVGYTQVVVEANLRKGDDDVLTGKRFLYPMLVAIDPNNNSVAQEHEVIGLSGEKILGMLDWFPSDGQNSSNFLVINTLRQNRYPKKDDGRILFYRLKLHEGHIKFDQKQVIGHEDCPGPVLALAPYGNSSIVYCTGELLKLRKLNMSSPVGKWENLMEYNLRSQACSISTKEPYIYVVSREKSLQVLRVQDDHIVPFSSDKEVRNGLNHLPIHEHALIMVSDAAHGIAGLRHTASPRLDNSTATIFKARLPVPITNFHRGPIQPSWYTRQSENPRAIIGCSLDGSFYQFEMISDAQWRLLRFIQEMANRNQILSPFSFDAQRNRQIGWSSTIKSTTHVNGDVLLRLLERGRPDPESFLQAMLNENPDSAHRLADSVTAANRMDRFTEVLENALGPLNGEDPVEVTVGFLRRILQVVL